MKCKQGILLFLIACFFYPHAGYGQDDFGGAWHDPGVVDGITDENCHVETGSEHSAKEDASGVHETTEEHTKITDSQGTKYNYDARETKNPDGSSQVHQQTTYTNQFGDQTVETNTWRYDQNGNLVDETHSMGKKGPESATPPDEGLEVTGVSNPGSPNEASYQTTYGEDYMKMRRSDLPVENIVDLSKEQFARLDYSLLEYYTASMYFCMEFSASIRNNFGSAPNLVSDMMAKLQASLPPTPEFEAAKAQIEASQIKLSGSVDPDPKDFSYEFTGKRGVISGHLAERVLVKYQGKPYKEVWLSLTISPLSFLNVQHISQKAKDYISGTPGATPEVRRAFSRLKLKEMTFGPPGMEDTRIARSVRRRKLKPNEFEIPRNFSYKGQFDASAFTEPLKELEQR